MIHKIFSSKMNLSRLEIFNELINSNFKVFRKENTNSAINSCNLYVISRTHLFCKSCLCEACREKINNLSRDFIYLIQNKLASKNYDKIRIVSSCKNWFSKPFFTEYNIADMSSSQSLDIKPNVGRPFLAFEEKKLD